MVSAAFDRTFRCHRKPEYYQVLSVQFVLAVYYMNIWTPALDHAITQDLLLAPGLESSLYKMLVSQK